MDMNLRNRLNNTKLNRTDCLLPLFEAISNSIHSIEESGRTDGRIMITVVRDQFQGRLRSGELPYGHLRIQDLVIEDNGTGFDSKNFKSFETADSPMKSVKGGKGIGRLMWLKAFDHALIDSHYEESGQSWNRSFVFSCTNDGVGQHKNATGNGEARTTQVRLVGFKEEYEKACPKRLDVIARKIVEHCLEYLVQGSCPSITLDDPTDGESINLTEYFREEMLVRCVRETFRVKSQDFVCSHVLVNSSSFERQHRLLFCAHNRTADSSALNDKLVPNLTFPLREADSDQSLIYFACISGKYLDENVSSERTGFNLAEDSDPNCFFLPDEVSQLDLRQHSARRAAEFLGPFLVPIKVKKRRQIEYFVAQKAPQYRALVKHRPGWLDSIPADLTDEKLDLELYKLDQRYGSELREQSLDIKVPDKQKASAEEYREVFERFAEEWNEHGMGTLARYVTHRKATLAMLEDRLGMREDGKFPLEETIHSLVFPLRKTSDDVRVENMNLWIIDERLSYHHYLASDMKLKNTDPIVVDSKGRPDVLIFNNSFAFADSDPPFGSVVLIEFKKPERDDYTDIENPISQILDYVRKIRDGEAIDRRGRTIRIPSHLPFYAYIVCDLTAKLRRIADNADFTLSADTLGYFYYQKKLEVYIEIISFEKLLGDSKKRNSILFDKLNIPFS